MDEKTARIKKNAVQERRSRLLENVIGGRSHPSPYSNYVDADERLGTVSGCFSACASIGGWRDLVFGRVIFRDPFGTRFLEPRDP